MRQRPNCRRSAAALLTPILVAAGCGDDATTAADGAESSAAAPSDTAASNATPAATGDPEAATPGTDAATDATPSVEGFPFTFTNCGREITIDAPPERVMLMEAAAPSLLFAAGAMDRVIARIEDFPADYYSADELALLEAIPALQADATSTGGVEVSLETVIEYEPDIIIGYDTETITPEALADVGIELYVMPPFCDSPPKPSFDSIIEEVKFYGKMFGTSDVADAAAVALTETVAGVEGTPVAAGKTAAALYVSSDGSAIYAYSALGMAHPQMEALGLTNVFAELTERVPEISIEEVISRNPDVLILLYDDTGLTPDEVTALVTDLPGASSITAVITDAVFPLLFNFAEPPTPLVVKGVGILAEAIGG
jgi:iron complex transport system substrate-binding protein